MHGALAAAPTDAAIMAAIKAGNPNSDIDGYRRVYAGPLGAQRDAVLATYTTVVTGGNLRGQSFGVFIDGGGRATLLPNKPDPAGQVDRVAVSNGQLLVHWMSYRPSDPQCCPSLPQTVAYVVGRSAVTAAH